MPERWRFSIGDVTHVVASILLALSAALVACAAAGFFFRDGSFRPLLSSGAIAGLLGFAGRRATRVPEKLNYREGFVTVSVAWTMIGAVGALPFYFSREIPRFTDAFFESVSGFTTTGATVLADIESVAPGILLWRSLTQWIGGMGIIVLGIAILPYLGVGGMQLFRAEMPGPTKDRLRPRIHETARILWVVYVGLTIIAVVLYRLGGMTLFDAVNHALTTLPTGGFSTRNASMAVFSPFIQWTAIVLMFLSGVNFTLHYRFLSRGPAVYWKDSEWRLYATVILCTAVLLALSIHVDGNGVGGTIRDAVFHVVATITTTGYGMDDYTRWSGFAQMLLFLLFFIGGMAGSTAGGPKAVRVLLILKHGFGEFRRYLHPQAVLVTKLSGRAVQTGVMLNVFAFMTLYVGIFGVGSLVMSATGLSLPGAASATAAAMSNVGPALAELGPASHYGFLPDWGKLFLISLMLVGRLEIYTVLLLFHPGLWRR